MPNPLSKVLPGRPYFFASHDALFDHPPEVICDIMAVSNTWSYYAYVHSDLLSVFLDSSHRAAYAMLAALTSSEARRAVIQAAAKESLTDRTYKLYEQLEKSIAASRATRNRFAHGLWCSLPKLKDSVVVIDAEDLAQGEIAMIEAGGAILLDDYLKALDYEKIWVYKYKELKEHRKAAEDALGMIQSFSELVYGSPSARRPRRSAPEKMRTPSANPQPKSPKKLQQLGNNRCLQNITI